MHRKFPGAISTNKVLIFCGLLGFNLAFGGFYEESGNQGFYFFEESQEEKKDKKRIPNTPEEAVEIIEEGKKELYELRCLAILNPSKENIERYVERQNKVLALSESFSKQWQYLLLDSPELGSQFDNPTSSSGVEVRKRSEELEKKKTLEKLKEKYFLVLFGEGGNLYSEHAGKIAKQFASISGWEVRAISLNGLALRSFSSVEKDRGISKKYGINNTPTFLMINPVSKQGFFVGSGAISVVELVDNIHIQAKRHFLKDQK